MWVPGRWRSGPTRAGALPMEDLIAIEATRIDSERRGALITMAAGAAGIAFTVSVVAACVLVPSISVPLTDFLNQLPRRVRKWVFIAPIAVSAFFAQAAWGAFREHGIAVERKRTSRTASCRSGPSRRRPRWSGWQRSLGLMAPPVPRPTRRVERHREPPCRPSRSPTTEKPSTRTAPPPATPRGSMRSTTPTCTGSSPDHPRVGERGLVLEGEVPRDLFKHTSATTQQPLRAAEPLPLVRRRRHVHGVWFEDGRARWSRWPRPGASRTKRRPARACGACLGPSTSCRAVR